MIEFFRGKYSFLSNFYDALVTYEGKTYRSAEAAFQAAKSLDDDIRRKFIMLEPYKAKRQGRKIELRPDWEEVKQKVMYDVLKSKFSNPNLKERLLATGDEFLVEGNTWGDTYWGFDVNKKSGSNVLGVLLMKLREELRENE